MGERQIVASVLTALVVAAIGVVAGPPASAADVTGTVDCTTPTSFVPSEIIVNPGDHIVLTVDPHCINWVIRPVAYPLLGENPQEISGVFTWVINPEAPLGTYGSGNVGEGALVFDNGSVGGTLHGQAFYVTARASSHPPTDGPAATVVPDWVQAYGRFGENAKCEAGWNPSWQQWAEPVTGGWVCTRSIPSLG